MEMLALAGARHFMRYLREISRMLGSGAVIRLIIPTQRVFDPCHCFLDIFIAVKCADANETVTTFTETGPRGCNHAGFFKQEIKKFPSIPFTVYPDIR